MSDDKNQDEQPEAMADAAIESEQPATAPATAAAEPAETAGAAAGDASAEDAPVAEAPVAEASEAPAADAPDAPAAEAPKPAKAAAAAGAPDKDARRGQPRRELKDLAVGERMKGKVVGLAKFGAFVDIGASTDGLVHITELPGKRVNNVEEVLKSGDAVEVWVKEVNLGTNRISLSMKTPTQNPMSKLAVGDVVSGTVTTVTQYGVFVDISSDTEGLVHISEMSSGFVSRPEDVAKPGETVEVRIKEVDAGRRRISLSMIGLANDSGPGPEESSGRGKQGGRGAREREEEYEMPQEPEERHPTVVELALRRALGQDDDQPAATDKKSESKRERKQALTDVYTRMLEEYRDTNR